jgi:SAM-dependent methyltransferase
MPDILDFSRRAELEEEMDGVCSYEELRRCLTHLAIVNRLTLAHRHTLRWLDENLPRWRRSGRPLTLVDIGCGYGDMLRRIERWAGKHELDLELIGADINPHALRAAREATPAGSRIQWVLGDVCVLAATQEVDLIASCGVFHHLSEPEIVRMLAWADATATQGWYITDLKRSAAAYRLFDVVSRGPWWQRFIRADGLRSIRRSFQREDWERMCRNAGVDAEITVRRPGRLSVSRMKPVEATAPHKATAAA